jgi:hypothetical protein
MGRWPSAKGRKGSIHSGVVGRGEGNRGRGRGLGVGRSRKKNGGEGRGFAERRGNEGGQACKRLV